MLHQTLISPFFSFHRPSSSSPLPYFHSSRVEKETSMDLEMICSGSQLQDEEPWTVEKGNLIFGEEFVDEFLDLGGLTETEKELDDEKKETEDEEELNSVSSAVSFEPPPPVSELALPSHDVAELEWVSRLMDDSLLEFPPPCSAVAVAVAVHPAEEISSAPVVFRAKSKRSKRTRSPSGSWSNWGPADYSTTSSSTTAAASSSNSSSSSYNSSSPLILFTPITDMSPAAKKQKIPKKRGRKPKPRPPLVPSISSSSAAAAAAAEVYYTQQQQQQPNSGTGGSERRCSHCGVNKTPQWRAGPLGAKTLCNACGVRFKSGRLLPEYRPACSPTFVSHVHSNSHRKVLEMRRKREEPETEKDHYLVCSAPAVPSF